MGIERSSKKACKYSGTGTSYWGKTRFFKRITGWARRPASVATAGDRLGAGFTVVKRMGRGSSSDALLVRKDGSDEEHVLKVACDVAHNDRLTAEGEVKIVPLRVAADFDVAAGDPDPRGLKVYGADGVEGGTIVDVWVDRSEMLFRYLELSVATQTGKRQVLLPINFSRISSQGVRVKSILGSQFAQVPGTSHPERVTLLEEEKVMAYYGGGVLYATPDRQEPLL